MTATPGASKPATDLVAAVRALLGGGSLALDAPALRTALADLHEFWLTTKAAELGITETSGFAIVATGGLGRGEMLPFSDLDLMLLYEESDAEVVSGTAESLWYPLWDANIRLDHSVRTVPEALRVASTDLTAALGLLEARHIAGDAELSELLIGGARRQWRVGIAGRFAELVDTTKGRWTRCGEIAHRAEPDLKNGRGGLRDTQLLSALALTQLADVYPSSSSAAPIGTLHDAHQALLNVRTELHRISGRGRDVLLAQHADEIGAALRVGDRFDLARLLSDSARTVSYYVDAGVRTAGNALPKRGFAALRRPVRRPLDEGVVEYNGEVMLARDARPERDPGLILRVAAASALTGLPMATATLTRLVDSAPELRAPWPQAALKDLLVLLSAGPAAVNTIEALDRTGLWGRLFPEWGAVRDLPPRDVIHVWTVDRHLAETVSRAGSFTTRVARPDLLVLAALLHDIGKGRGGDHSAIGAELATQVGARLGLWPSDIKVLSAAVRHHLLLVSTATRRDLQDPAVIAAVVDAIEGDSGLLELLHALAEADSLATGPGVWGEWKASLIGDLVRRCRLVLAGEPLPRADPIDPRFLELAASGAPGTVHVAMVGPDTAGAYSVTVLAPDRPGVLSRSAGVLALNALRVCSASVNSTGGHALDTFVVTPHFGAPPAPELLRQQLALALGGELDVAEALRPRDREAIGKSVAAPRAAVPVNPPAAPPRILWHDGAEPGQRLVEVRATDAPGLLTALTAVFERAGVDIAWAKVTTLGSSVIDVFAVTVPTGQDAEAARARLEAQLFAVLPAPAPAKPEGSDAQAS